MTANTPQRPAREVPSRLRDGRLAALVEAAKAGERQRSLAETSLSSLTEDTHREERRSDVPAESLVEVREREYYASEMEARAGSLRSTEEERRREGKLDRERSVDAIAEEGMPKKMWVRSGEWGYRLDVRKKRHALYSVPWDILRDATDADERLDNPEPDKLRERLEEVTDRCKMGRRALSAVSCLSLLWAMPALLLTLATLIALLPGVGVPGLSVYIGVLQLEGYLAVLFSPVLIVAKLALPRRGLRKYLKKKRLRELESAAAHVCSPLMGAEPASREGSARHIDESARRSLYKKLDLWSKKRVRGSFVGKWPYR